MATLTEKQAKLFLDKNFGHVATIRPDGTPHVTPVWVDYDGERVLFNTARGRGKVRYIERDPRVTITVSAVENPYQYVSVTGTAEFVDEGAEEHIDKMAKKYIDQDTYPWRAPGEQRVIVRIRPERVQAFAVD